MPICIPAIKKKKNNKGVICLFYPETKVYFDGSHYIGIPKTEGKKNKKVSRKHNEFITIFDNNDCSDLQANKRIVSKQDYFDELYKDCADLSIDEKKEFIAQKMTSYFSCDDDCFSYIDFNIERHKKNLCARRTRMIRKASLQKFNYFCTFTYDSSLHSEETFKKGLRTVFKNLCYRKSWKIMGAWEFSPENNRLHYHGLFYIPEGSMPGEIEEIEDYNFKSKRRVKVHQNSYFKERFGRNDFEFLEDNDNITSAIKYMLKYIEKSGGKIMYSKGLPQYFISDINSNDVVCSVGVGDKKILLYDDFECYDEGEFMGRVSDCVIDKLRKAN